VEGYITRKAGPVVPVDVAPDELLNKMRWLRDEPVHNIESIENIMHGQPPPYKIVWHNIFIIF